MCSCARSNAHTCNCVTGSVMSIRNYFGPSNRLSEPTGCISLHVPSPESQGTSSWPCTRSAEYFLRPVTAHSIVPPRWKNNEHTRVNFQGKCPMVSYDCSFFTAMHSISIGMFSGSLSHTASSTATFLGGVEYNNTYLSKNFSMAVTLSICSCRLHICSVAYVHVPRKS